MGKNDEMKGFFEVTGLDVFKGLANILAVGAVMTLPLLVACTIAEWLSSLY